MSAIAIAVGTAVVGVYGASKASSAAKSAAASQERAAGQFADQADRAAQLSYDLGQDQLAFSRRQYEELSPLARQVAQSQMAAQDEQMRQARDYFDYQQQTFRPVEQGLVRDAERFSTEGYREQLAGQAAAAAGRAFGVQQDMGQRAMAARGVNPNSGAALALQAQGNLGLAAQRANAMTGARTQAEQMGFARRLDVTGLGRGLAGASTAAYGGATGAGSAGVNAAMAPGNQFMQGMGQAGNTMLAGSGQALGAYGSLYSGANQAAMGAQNNYMGLLGGLVGMGGTVAAAKFGQR
jgi:hypothetical protein